MLQVKVTVQAFLARPVDTGLQSFDDCAQVVEPFSITTSIDRCAEPAPMGTYRCCRPWAALLTSDILVPGWSWRMPPPFNILHWNTHALQMHEHRLLP